MGCKDGDGLGKYRQGTTTNLRAYRRSGTMNMADKNSSEDRGGRARWHIYITTGMDTVVEDMRDSNRRDVGRRRWQNGLEERRWNGKILSGNDYQTEGVLSIRDNGDDRQGQR